MSVRSITLLLVALAGSNAHAQQKLHLYSNPKCGMRFQFPVGWLVRQQATDTATDKNELCTVRVQPRNLAQRIRQNDDVDLYTIEISTTKRDFDSAADAGGFERGKSGWVVLGRAGQESSAERISRPKVSGLRGTASVGCYHQDDRGYAGLCEVPRALLNDGSNLSAIFYRNPQSGEEFDAILASFQFLR